VGHHPCFVSGVILMAETLTDRGLIRRRSRGGPYHAWQETTPYLKRMLDDAGIFQVDVVTAPPRGGDFSAFKPDWSK
jgi:uncharacterized protein